MQSKECPNTHLCVDLVNEVRRIGLNLHQCNLKHILREAKIHRQMHLWTMVYLFLASVKYFVKFLTLLWTSSRLTCAVMIFLVEFKWCHLLSVLHHLLSALLIFIVLTKLPLMSFNILFPKCLDPILFSSSPTCSLSSPHIRRWK